VTFLLLDNPSVVDQSHPKEESTMPKEAVGLLHDNDHLPTTFDTATDHEITDTLTGSRRDEEGMKGMGKGRGRRREKRNGVGMRGARGGTDRNVRGMTRSVLVFKADLKLR